MDKISIFNRIAEFCSILIMGFVLPNIVRVIQSRKLRRASHVARLEEGKSAFNILTGTPAGKRPSGRSRHR